MPALSFTPSDVALAADKLVDEAVSSIPYTTQAELEAQTAGVTVEWMSAVKAFAKLHGVTADGDPFDGDEEVADRLVEEIKAYRENPAGYFDANIAQRPAMNEGDGDPAQDAYPSSSILMEQQAVADVVSPDLAMQAATVIDFNRGPVAQQTNAGARITMVDKPVSVVFPNITGEYSTDLVPTVAWHTPRPQIKDPDPHYRFDGMKVAVMALALEERANVMATGDPGCGKTEFFHQFGRRIGLPTHKIPMDGSLTRSEIIGSFRQVATDKGSATPFVQGMIPRLIQQPGIIILDEIDQADPDIMYMLHSVLEGEGLLLQEEGGLFIPRHPHCYIVATANTKGRGSDTGLTHTRFEMSEATRDRFPYWLSFTYMKEDEEIETIHAKTGLPIALCRPLVAIGNEIREGYKNGTLSQTCSLRQMLNVAPAAKRFASHDPQVGLAIGIGLVIAGRANNEDAATIRRLISDHLAYNIADAGL